MQQRQTTLIVSLEEAARRLSLSSRTIATLVARNELASVKVGRRRLIPVAELEAFIKRDHRITTASNAQRRRG